MMDSIFVVAKSFYRGVVFISQVAAIIVAGWTLFVAAHIGRRCKKCNLQRSL
jgi:hypothetical protein